MAAQKRGLHTLRRRRHTSNKFSFSQRRDLHIPESQSNKLLSAWSIPICEDEDSRSRDRFLEITIDRENHTPCIITSFSIGGESPTNHAKSHPIKFDRTVDASTFSSIATELNCKKESFNSLTRILTSLMDLFFNKDAFSLVVRISRNSRGKLAVARSDFTFDDAAIRSGNRQEDILAMRDVATEILEEVEAEKDGIVYIKWAISFLLGNTFSDSFVTRLKGEGDIGTLGKPPQSPSIILPTNMYL